MHTKFSSFRPPTREGFSSTHCFSLGEDPLWKQVCAEVLSIMGPFALQIRQVHLGALSSRDKTVDLYCQSEDIAQFIQRYDFLILGSLQHYFPALKKLRIRSEVFPKDCPI
jgi:hypothetical protein